MLQHQRVKYMRKFQLSTSTNEPGSVITEACQHRALENKIK